MKKALVFILMFLLGSVLFLSHVGEAAPPPGEEPPAEKVLVAVKEFIVHLGAKRFWSRTFEFPGKVVGAKTSWSDRPPHSGFVTGITTSGNTVKVNGEIFSGPYGRGSLLDVRLTVEYVSEPSQTIEEPPAEKVLVAVKYFREGTGVKFPRFWSRTFEFPGKVVGAKASWSDIPLHSGFVRDITMSGNTVKVDGEIFKKRFGISWVEVTLTVEYVSEPSQTIEEPPAEKVLVAVKEFTEHADIRFREVWSRTFEFPGKVVDAKASWRGSWSDSGLVTYITMSGNTVKVDGEIFSEFVGARSWLDVRLTVEYVSEPSQTIEDINGDSVVNIQDLVLVVSQFGKSRENAADVNRDGVVNILDLVLVASALGEDAAAPSVHVQSLAMLSASEVQQWLVQVQQLSPRDVTLQRGIAVLEQLLAALAPPKKTVLLRNYPNPFNPETWLPYHLAEPAEVTLSIYSAGGQLVRTLALGYQPAGIYENKSRAAYWDGRNAVGERVASGLYFYTLTAGDFAATGKMLIRK